ncbi:MAG: porin family protein [Cyclobacteriaceae bacterium]
MKRSYRPLKLTRLVAMALVAATMLLASKAQAQESFPDTKFGIRAGGNVNSWTNQFPSTDFEGQQVFPDDWKVHYGYHGGVYVNIRLSELVALEPALLYSAKGTGTILSAGGSTIKGTINSNYLDIPFLLRLYVADGFNLFLGPQFSYQLSSDFDFTVDGVKVIQGENITNNISEFDVAPILGLGYEFENGLNLNLSGELGLLTVDSFDQLSTFNRNIRFSVGYSF